MMGETGHDHARQTCHAGVMGGAGTELRCLSPKPCKTLAGGAQGGVCCPWVPIDMGMTKVVKVKSRVGKLDSSAGAVE